MRNVCLSLAALAVVACSSNPPRSPFCGEGTTVVNPQFPDGGVTDAGVPTYEGCQAACKPQGAAGCQLEKVDGGPDILYCIPCFG